MPATADPQRKCMPTPLLIDHPLQGELFAPLREEQFARLKDSLAADGQRDPIVVMPPGNTAGLDAYTILDGHQRRDAAVELGWDEVDVLVRHDLIDADANEVDQVFLSYNFDRRQLDPLDQTAVMVRLYAATINRPPERFSSYNLKALTTQVASFLGMSEKNATRYIRIAQLPAAIQSAFQNGLLNLDPAARLWHEPTHVQEQIAAAIDEADDDVDIKALARTYIQATQPRPTQRSVGPKLEAMCKAAEAFKEAYGDQVDDITHISWRTKFLTRLEAAHEVHAKLIQQLRSIDAEGDAIADLARDVM